MPCACRNTRRPSSYKYTKPCCGDEKLDSNLFFENIQNSPNSFITTWRTTTPNEEIQLPVGGDVDFFVLWGDGTFSKITSSVDPVTHTYSVPGDYNVFVFGSVEQWDTDLLPPSSPSNQPRQKLIGVVQYGKVGLKKLNFKANTNLLNISALDTPETSITDMSEMFAFVPANPDVSQWNSSKVTNMSGMFGFTSINPDVSNWDVSSVTDMSNMFIVNSEANPDVSKWDVSKVTNMSGMFSGALLANPNTANWVTSSVTDMSNMFFGAQVANPNTENWDVSKVTNMSGMFASTPVANPNTANWITSSVTDMSNMFNSAQVANPNTFNWDVSSVTNMGNMFASAQVANPNVSIWNTSSVENMIGLFSGATSATPNVSAWNMSSVTQMAFMFAGATSANPNISLWTFSSLPSIYSPTVLNNFMLNSGFDQTNYENAIVMFDNETSIPGVQWLSPTGVGGLTIAGTTPVSNTAHTNLIGRVPPWNIVQ